MYNRKRNGRFSKMDYRKKRFIALRVFMLLIACLWAYVIIGGYNLYEAIANPPIVEPSKVSKLSIEEQICQASGGENCDVLVRLAKCESSLNPEAININSNKTFDLGLFQWNSVHFKDKITPSCALDVRCSTIKTNEEIKKGHLHWWVCSKYI